MSSAHDSATARGDAHAKVELHRVTFSQPLRKDAHDLSWIDLHFVRAPQATHELFRPNVLASLSDFTRTEHLARESVGRRALHKLNEHGTLVRVVGEVQRARGSRPSTGFGQHIAPDCQTFERHRTTLTLRLTDRPECPEISDRGALRS